MKVWELLFASILLINKYINEAKKNNTIFNSHIVRQKTSGGFIR